MRPGKKHILNWNSNTKSAGGTRTALVAECWNWYINANILHILSFYHVFFLLMLLVAFGLKASPVKPAMYYQSRNLILAQCRMFHISKTSMHTMHLPWTSIVILCPHGQLRDLPCLVRKSMLQWGAGRRCFLSIGIEDYGFRPLKHAEKDAEVLAFKFQTRSSAVENVWYCIVRLELQL